jgi:hypothetical protein
MTPVVARLGSTCFVADRYHESGSTFPGDEAVVTDIAGVALGLLGLSVCYDLRFPELNRALSSAGAEALVVPAAFTLVTGKDHWHVLLTPLSPVRTRLACPLVRTLVNAWQCNWSASVDGDEPRRHGDRQHMRRLDDGRWRGEGNGRRFGPHDGHLDKRSG